jgi:hypothetical protein
LNLKGVEKLNNAQIQERRGKKGSQEYGENEKVEQHKRWTIDEPKHDKGWKVG